MIKKGVSIGAHVIVEVSIEKEGVGEVTSLSPTSALANPKWENRRPLGENTILLLIR